jgi:hypothetical protein
MGDRIAQRHYNRALARSANIGSLPLEAEGAGGWSCWRYLLLGSTLGHLGTHHGLEARTATHGIARWCHDSEWCFGDEPCLFPHE